MCPERKDATTYESNTNDNNITNQEVCEPQCQPMSPINQVISKYRGGQSIYAIICAYFLIILSAKITLLFVSNEERTSCINFFGGQFASIGYFVQLFIAHHLILYTLVYPVGKLFANNSFILKLTALITMVLCKMAVYTLVYSKEDSSTVIRTACGCESIRIMMKAISFLFESHSLTKKKNAQGKTNEDVTFGNFTYFLFAPTLIYQTEYKRTNKPINWKAFAIFFTEFIVIKVTWGLFIKDLFIPAQERHMRTLNEKPDEVVASFIRIFLFHISHALIMFFSIAFGFLHSYCNAMAELLCFADRSFYKDWWVNTSAAEFLRKWNRIIGDWLHEYVYKNCLDLGFDRYTAMTFVFVLSGLYHDYLNGVTTRIWSPCFTILMSASMIPVFLAAQLKKLNRITYNIIGCLFGVIAGGSIAIFISQKSKLQMKFTLDEMFPLLQNVTSQQHQYQLVN